MPLSPEEHAREAEMLRELKKFHKENKHLGAPLLTSIHKKRLKVPQPNLEEHPFCLDRQLADEYERQNFNRNPRFYSHTLTHSPRMLENPHNHSSFINENADIMASSGFSPRFRAEFTTNAPAIKYEPMQYKKPSVITVDPSDFRHVPASEAPTPSKLPPSHVHYGATLVNKTVSFGHRPQSASRMYNPSTSSIQSLARKRKQPEIMSKPTALTPIKTGMSVLKLQELLTPSKTKQTMETSSPQSFGTRKVRQEEPDEEETRRIQREREKQYNNAMYIPPKPKKPMRTHPPEETTAELLDKFRKLAVGKLPGDQSAATPTFSIELT